ncbi:hypothetical protein NMG60_11031061 [Bertholletia excelsa]
MTWVCSKKSMGMKRELACLYLLLLILIELETPCLAAGFSKFGFKGGSGSVMKTHKCFNGNAGKGGECDDAFGAEKRKVYTGPNPLHNR